MSEIKTCASCKWVAGKLIFLDQYEENSPNFWWCDAPSIMNGATSDLVSGELTPRVPRNCRSQREVVRPDHCGPSGQWWEKAE